MEDNFTKMGEVIKTFRELKKLSREYVADELEISVSTYAKIERDEQEITFSRIQKICKTLNITVCQLLTIEPSNILRVNEDPIITPFDNVIKTKNEEESYKEKYIRLLEEELQFLKANINQYIQPMK